jgi:predicted RNase H-like nuclease
VCIFDSDGRLHVLSSMVATPCEFAQILASYGPDIVAGVDAPLVVTHLRSAERSLSRSFGRFKASAHSANVELLTITNRLAGPLLHDQLLKRGFSFNPAVLERRGRGRHAMEVYPHAAHVILFGLEERLPYKRKRGRTVAFIRTQLLDYQQRLRGLLQRDLPILLEDVQLQALLDTDPVACKGLGLKRLEDMLDSVTCAYVAWHAWEQGAAGLEMFGDEHGHIVVPRDGATTFSPALSSP